MQASNSKNALARLATPEMHAGAVLALTLMALARPQWSVVAVAILAALWGLRWLATGRLTAPTAFDWCVVGLLVAVPASLWMSADFSTSVAEASRLVLGIGIFYALVNGAHQDRLLLSSLVLLLAGAAALAMVGLLGGMAAGSQFLSLPSSIVQLALPQAIHANVLGTSLMLVLPLAFAVAWDGAPLGWPAWLRWLAVLVAGLALLALVFTQSRGSYVGLAAAAGVLVWMRWPRLRWLVLALVALAAAGLLGLLLADRLPDIVVDGALGRLAVWQRGLYALEDFPLTGLGFGLFGEIVPVLYPYFTIGAGPLALAPHAHNVYLQLGVDLGLLGLVSFVAFLLVAARLLHWMWQQSRGESGIHTERMPGFQALVWGLAGSLMALAVNGLIDAAIWVSKASPLLWLLLGLVAALSLRSRQALSLRDDLKATPATQRSRMNEATLARPTVAVPAGRYPPPGVQRSDQ